MSFLYRPPGHMSYKQGNWGKVAKCPHCPATDILRNSPDQVTCGKAACVAKQCSLRSAEAKAKARTKRKPVDMAEIFSRIRSGA